MYIVSSKQHAYTVYSMNTRIQCVVHSMCIQYIVNSMSTVVL